MILLFDTDFPSEPRLLSSLPAGSHAHVVTTWELLVQHVTRARCAVVLIEQLRPARAWIWQHLDALKRRRPMSPIVLVTCAEPDNARHLRGLPVDEVVWLQEAARMLGPTVARVRTRPALEVVAEMIEVHPALSECLRDALAHACVVPHPIRTVQELARVAGRSRSTLVAHWRQAMGGNPSLRLQDVVDWLILLRALDLRRHKRKWTAISVELGVDARTLSRWSQRLAGCSLTRLEAGEVSQSDRCCAALFTTPHATFCRSICHPALGGCEDRG